MEQWASPQVDLQGGAGEHDTAAETWDSDTGRTHLVEVKPALIQLSTTLCWLIAGLQEVEALTLEIMQVCRTSTRWGYTNSNHKEGDFNLGSLLSCLQFSRVRNLSWWRHKWTCMRQTVQESGPRSANRSICTAGFTLAKLISSKTKERQNKHDDWSAVTTGQIHTASDLHPRTKNWRFSLIHVRQHKRSRGSLYRDE